MPPTTHCRVGPPMPGYLAVYGPPDASGAEPVVCLVPVTNANAAADAALFAGAARLLAEAQAARAYLRELFGDDMAAYKGAKETYAGLGAAVAACEPTACASGDRR